MSPDNSFNIRTETVRWSGARATTCRPLALHLLFPAILSLNTGRCNLRPHERPAGPVAAGTDLEVRPDEDFRCFEAIIPTIEPSGNQPPIDFPCCRTQSAAKFVLPTSRTWETFNHSLGARERGVGMAIAEPVTLNTIVVPVAPRSPVDIAALYDAGTFRDVTRRYASALTRYPDSFHLLNFLAYARYQIGDLHEAATLLRSSLEINPQQPEMLNNYGVVLRDSEDFSQALDNFNRAHALDPRTCFEYNRSLVQAELEAHAIFTKLQRSIPMLARLFETRPPAYIFCYHKTGTILFSNILKRLLRAPPGRYSRERSVDQSPISPQTYCTFLSFTICKSNSYRLPVPSRSDRPGPT